MTTLSEPKTLPCEPKKKVNGDALKTACKSGTTIRRIDLPVITTEQYAEIAIRCAKQVYREKGWHAWADAWLDTSSRSDAAAVAEADAAYAAAEAAADAAYAAADAANIDVIAIIHQVVGVK